MNIISMKLGFNKYGLVIAFLTILNIVIFIFLSKSLEKYMINKMLTEAYELKNLN